MTQAPRLLNVLKAQPARLEADVIILEICTWNVRSELISTSVTKMWLELDGDTVRGQILVSWGIPSLTPEPQTFELVRVEVHVYMPTRKLSTGLPAV